MSQSIDFFCKEALKKEYTDIIKLSYILGQDEQYKDECLLCLWKTLDMAICDKKEPDLSSINTKIGTWFKILLRVTTRKIAGIIYPLKILPLVNYNYDQDSGTLQKPPDKESGNFIKLSDLTSYFKDQLEMEPPSKLFPLQECLLPKERTNSGYIQQGETEDDKLENFISWVKYEVELFYSRLKDALKASGKNVGDATQSTALDVFDKNMGSFDKIEREDLKGDFYGGEHPTRAKGLIANKIMKRVDGNLFFGLKGKAHGQKLDKFFIKKPMK